jgi:hypothetical protein
LISEAERRSLDAAISGVEDLQPVALKILTLIATAQVTFNRDQFSMRSGREGIGPKIAWWLPGK